jgi:hypothetical protein
MTIQYEISDSEIERIKRFVPATVKRRKLVLDSIVTEIEKNHHFKELDEKNDLTRIVPIVQAMYPENDLRKIKEWSRIAIQLWNQRKKQE